MYPHNLTIHTSSVHTISQNISTYPHHIIDIIIHVSLYLHFTIVAHRLRTITHSRTLSTHNYIYSHIVCAQLHIVAHCLRTTTHSRKLSAHNYTYSHTVCTQLHTVAHCLRTITHIRTLSTHNRTHITVHT